MCHPLEIKIKLYACRTCASTLVYVSTHHWDTTIPLYSLGRCQVSITSQGAWSLALPSCCKTHLESSLPFPELKAHLMNVSAITLASIRRVRCAALIVSDADALSQACGADRLKRPRWKRLRRQSLMSDEVSLGNTHGHRIWKALVYVCVCECVRVCMSVIAV